MKFGEEVVEIVEAFDLTGTYRGAGELAECSPTTVARYVALRGVGLPQSRRLRRAGLMDGYLEKVEEWVNASRGRVRADVVSRKLAAMGYQGSERTVRRAVRVAKEAYGQGHRRVYRPWIVEPGLWFQWDYGQGPVVEGRETILFCAWLAWSRYRVIIPILDRTLPTVIWCLDQALRRFGGCPTYGLSDNEKTLTVEHVAGIAIREPVMVTVGRWYGVSLRSCIPYDPESKGGAESTVRVAKADLVPTEANLRDQYSSFRELEEACRELEAEVNIREHRATRRIPGEMVVEERARLHPLPEEPYTLAFGVARRVGQTTAMVSYEGGSYSVPDQLVGQVVWVRGHGEEVIVVHVGREGPKEVARHLRTTPGTPRVDDRHFPVRQSDPLDREPRARTQEEAEFLQLGPQAAAWLKAAGAGGAPRVRSKMALAVSLAKVLGGSRVAEALGKAAASGRFADGDLESIVAHLTTSQVGSALRPSDDHSLQGGTAGWAALRA